MPQHPTLKGTLMRTRLLAAVAGPAVALAAFTACATPAPDQGGPGGSGPGGAARTIEAAVGWLDGGRTIAVVTWGSSSCVPELGDAKADDGALIVSLREPTARACTEDYGPRSLAVGVPADIDTTLEVPVEIVVGDARADIALDPYTGGSVEEFTPSAGWVRDDMIALQTWGSSSCPPVVEDVRVASPASVVVRFATPDADQVCTADMAPQLTVVQLDPDAEVDRDATVSFGVLGSAAEVPIR